MLDKFPRPTIFAHRGASAFAPENTIPAFELAVHQGADVIELDVKLTADRKVIVFHDRTLERITGEPGQVNECTLDEIHTLDAGIHFDVSFRGEPIPTLFEVFDTIGDRSFDNIELTNYASLNDSLPEKVAEIIRNRKLINRVLISSFNPIALLRIRRQLPGISIALLSRPGRNGALARSRLGYVLSYQALHIAVMDITKSIIKRTHQRHCRIHPYSINEVEEFHHAIQMGVDGIFTNDPVMAKRALTC
jgi:glycerophosphoryl diester phosphodiesterase